jgi:hypothetical protein
MQTVAAHPAGFVNGVLGPRNHQHLPQIGPLLDVARLLQQIRAHPTGCLSEEFRDVEDAQCSRAKTWREWAAGHICAALRTRRSKQVQLGNDTRRVISQSSHPADRACRSCRRDVYSREESQRPESCSGDMSAGPGSRWMPGSRWIRKSTGPLPPCPAAPPPQPSRYAPVRNGLVIRSTPMVVSGPCPL